MDIAAVIHPDGAPDWLLGGELVAQIERDSRGEVMLSVARWRDFLDTRLHVGSAPDAPWTFPELKLVADVGRPVDQIAAAMDGRVRTSPETPPWLLNQLLSDSSTLRTELDGSLELFERARLVQARST